MHSPFTQFSHWFAEAQAHAAIKEPTAMTLATLGVDGYPRSRIVLLKDYDADGFTFYTNHAGAKGRELLAYPKASLLFYWMPLCRQVRIEGDITVVSDAEADAYFASRPRGSQIGAWASLQSEPLDSMDTLKARVIDVETTYAGRDVPRPPHWSGFRLAPHYIEFWNEKPFRLHERDSYTRANNGQWVLSHLYP